MGDKMKNRKLLSLTLNELMNVSLEDVLSMIKSNLDEVSNYSREYALSIASALVKRILLIKNFSRQYEKFYKIIFSVNFRKNEYIYDCLNNENLSSLKDLFDIYDDNDKLIDKIFSDDEKLFDELVLSNEYDIKNVFSKEIINNFRNESYKKLLSYLLKDKDKVRVVKSLFKKKNYKFLYMVSTMDDLVLRYVKDDTEYFNMILSLLNYNEYRKLIWDYYNNYIGSLDNERIMNTDKFVKEVPDELKELLNYSFNLMNIIYSTDTVPNIISNVHEMIRCFNEGKDMVHVAVFGVEGYKKVKAGHFDVLLDYSKMENDNQLLNLKIAFFSTIYGLTFVQAEKLIKSFDTTMKSFKGTISKEDQLIYETIIAMKSLYNLTLNDKEEIDLYREVYYKYIKRNGIYATVEVEALVIMEKLMRRMYNNSIELL